MSYYDKYIFIISCKKNLNKTNLMSRPSDKSVSVTLLRRQTMGDTSTPVYT